MIRRPPRSTLSSSSAASDVYKRQERGRPLTVGPLVPAEQRASEIGRRVQDGGKNTARLGRGGHHAGLSLQRRRRLGPRSPGVERNTGKCPHRQVVLRSRVHLRAGEGLQEGD